MHNRRRSNRGGFSLIELVIVVVIIGIIGAIAIPRMSRGAAGAAEGALTANLTVLRNAIDLYAAEHNGDFPTADDIVEQLTGKSAVDGGIGEATEGDLPRIYGPYVREIPPLPVGTNKGSNEIDAASETPGTTDAGWLYDPDTGEIRANLADTEEDEAEKAYNAY